MAQDSRQNPLKFLITGATGFVSGCVAADASKNGHAVVKISRPWDDLTQQIAHEKPDVVFHGAGSASVAESVKNPEQDRECSVGTWKRLLTAVQASGCKPLVVFPSSAAVYGNPAKLPVCETSVLNPISPYGRHKVECEELAGQYRVEHGLPVVVFRLFSLFGSGQKRLLVRELFEQAVSEQSTVSLQGTGHETRDYLSAEDFGRAIVHFAERFCSQQIGLSDPWVFNLASGVETSVRELAELITADCGSNKPVVCLNRARPGDPTRWVADMCAFKQACPDWSPRPFCESLRETLQAWEAESTAA
ncbi:MAG: SDR family oxidoreductase [Verrucomicrobiaceae bacterium]|nr:SDR family oxidoreductase [Verrucomicrobiaceae bacterium]